MAATDSNETGARASGFLGKGRGQEGPGSTAAALVEKSMALAKALKTREGLRVDLMRRRSRGGRTSIHEDEAEEMP